MLSSVNQNSYSAIVSQFHHEKILCYAAMESGQVPNLVIKRMRDALLKKSLFTLVQTFK